MVFTPPRPLPIAPIDFKRKNVINSLPIIMKFRFSSRKEIKLLLKIALNEHFTRIKDLIWIKLFFKAFLQIEVPTFALPVYLRFFRKKSR